MLWRAPGCDGPRAVAVPVLWWSLGCGGPRAVMDPGLRWPLGCGGPRAAAVSEAPTSSAVLGQRTAGALFVLIQSGCGILQHSCRE